MIVFILKKGIVLLDIVMRGLCYTCLELVYVDSFYLLFIFGNTVTFEDTLCALV